MSKPKSSHFFVNMTTAAVGGTDRSASKRNGRMVAPHRRKRAQVFFRRKYLMDRFLGAALLVVTSPLLFVLFFLVKFTSPGPGFYRQKRVGLDGRTFEIVKLRSMVRNAERPGKPKWSTKNDSRVTPLGRILRQLHLDELPQLYNVARGDMSLVGPRPERPEICEKLAEKIDGYYDRVLVKPGVTGLAQINLPPDESVDDVQRKQILDLQYIEEANHWLEFRIILATAMRMFGVRSETIVKSMRLSRQHLLAAASVAERESQRQQSKAPRPQEPTPRFVFSPDSDSGVLL